MRQQKLLNLIKNNYQAQGKKFEVQMNAEREATVYLYDVIDNWFGINSEEFAKTLAGLDVETIHLRWNSPGGDVFDARAMYTAIKQHPANTISHIDGLAASAATYASSAADTTVITEGAFYMIHKGWTLGYGNADDFRTTAELLDKVDMSIAKDYAQKTGLEIDQLIGWMAEEKWMDASEALELGFVDSVFDGDSAVENKFDLSVYDRAPENAVAMPQNLSKPTYNAKTPFYKALTQIIAPAA